MSVFTWELGLKRWLRVYCTYRRTVLRSHYPCQEAHNHQLTQAPSDVMASLGICTHMHTPSPIQKDKNKQTHKIFEISKSEVFKALFIYFLWVCMCATSFTQRSKASRSPSSMSQNQRQSYKIKMKHTHYTIPSGAGEMLRALVALAKKLGQFPAHDEAHNQGN